MLVTPLILKDCAQVSQLHQATFYRGWNQKDFEEFVKDPLVFGLKIHRAQTLYGYIVWREVEDEAEILTLVVSPEFHRQGIGSRLLIALFEQLKSKGLSKLFLEVAEDNNDAQLFYVKNGFVFLGKRENYYARPNNQLVPALNYFKSI